ncbi:hypothetical protein L6164_034274 [Bauhinia variegata]|uniref:Uncharacterized protein n=1 Tax=Bauhinia variegata TaxID=167791 RepID=A0ACB9KU74_BAUVA|nr:hypothetical protein L6164_034274 [Bauhinia variegata]
MAFSPVFGVAALLLCFFTVEGNDSAIGNLSSTLVVDVNGGRTIPETLFGIFFEEINHAGAGGLWAELVSNRGFESGGRTVPSGIFPWTVIGNESDISVETDATSCFENNKIALRMEVHSDNKEVGVSNPGYWGMNIEQGKKYKVVFYGRSETPIQLTVSFVGDYGQTKLASATVSTNGTSGWRKFETILEAQATDHHANLQITASKKGVIWLDQVSAMPVDTFKGHGFRNDLAQMLVDMKPRFLRFPGGCFVEGGWLRNAFRWKETVGPWEERPGHFGDVWMYWTDDGIGYFEFLQLAEDLGTPPIWVFNNGISHNDEVNTSVIWPFVQEALDGIEFARGDPKSKWGSLRADMGHPTPFNLTYVAVGNEDCGKYNYQGNYLVFYNAIKKAYPDIKIISNCDATAASLDHPADLYDFHIYTTASDMFSQRNKFDKVTRGGAKAFVSEYAVWHEDAGSGSLFAAVAEAGFLIGLELNSDAVSMASYAPLFVNTNDRSWMPDSIVFDSYQLYGTPSYWMQHFFKESSGALLLNSTLQSNSSSLAASAIAYQNAENKQNFVKIKVVNFGETPENLTITLNGLDYVQQALSTMTVLTSANKMDENSFADPMKIVPKQTPLKNASKDMTVQLASYSITSFDLCRTASN